MNIFSLNIITNSDAIKKAITDAERLLSPDSPMMQEIKYKDDFEYGAGKGIEVFTRIATSTIIAPVFSYRPKWVWSKSLGYSDKSGIHLNVYKLENLDHESLVGLLIHEWLHQVGFSHGNNFKTKFKVDHSVNYFASENVERWLSKSEKIAS
jgi:hypothetical protein